MEEILTQALPDAQEAFSRLKPGAFDYFCIGFHFVRQDTTWRPASFHFIMETLAVHEDTNYKVPAYDLCSLAKPLYLGNLSKDFDTILKFIQKAHSSYPNNFRVFIPPFVLLSHGLDAKQGIDENTLVTIITRSVQMQNFSYWGNQVGFRIDSKGLKF